MALVIQRRFQVDCNNIHDSRAGSGIKFKALEKGMRSPTAGEDESIQISNLPILAVTGQTNEQYRRSMSFGVEPHEAQAGGCRWKIVVIAEGCCQQVVITFRFRFAVDDGFPDVESEAVVIIRVVTLCRMREKVHGNFVFSSNGFQETEA
jgi:hypothetical protein